MNETLQNKYNLLLQQLKNCGSLAVAFSGGVDSAFLVYAAHEALGEKLLAITVTTQSYPRHEAADAAKILQNYGVKHAQIELNQLAIPGFCENGAQRCYYCKYALFSAIKAEAAKHGITAVADGANTDDENDYRPGMRATAELGILSPLREAGFSKQDIRDISKELGIFTWNKPSYACLASRIPYGEEITPEKLAMVEKAEQALLDMGFKEMRVRCHGKLARIEVAENDFAKAAAQRKEISAAVKNAGFLYAALDLEGFRSGSLNAALENKNA
jgi:uncharacterized protein